MICSACGTDNETGRKFCSECGARLAIACPACAAPNSPTAKFCGECGASLAAGARPGAPAAVTPSGASPAPAPVAERRLVTVLFADLVGFTPFAEERDAEDVREALSRYFDLASEVIARHGGTVEKFIGDAVMAVWGTPVAREDDAERAVRAGLELVDAVRSLGPGIGARAGILTGEAAVTLGATNQGLVAGDLVNTAARLQSVAPPGTVLVGEATVRAAAASVDFEEAGEQLLRGKAAPVPAWRALRVVAERGGRNRRETLEAPFVGRVDELRLLKDLYHAAVRERRPRHVSIAGLAGIGKSRLAWEFLKYVDGLVEPVWWHDGRSPAYGEGITFWALGEMVRARAGLLESDDEATTRAKVTETVAAHVPDPDERRWIEPALLALLGVETTPGGSEQLFGAWRTFFERLAVSAPVVMVFEDLHHADAGLLDFIDHLLEWSRGVPIYVLTLARPELLDRRPGWGAGRRNFASLHLEPLPEPAMRELLAGLVPGLPEAAVRAIVARADGVPLYAVETVRMLLADGLLVGEGGRFRPVGDLADLAVPATLRELIAARLDALEPADRGLLQDAAVLGQSFTSAAVAAVSGLDEAALAPRLLGLVRREILAVEANPRSPERGQHAFVQSLVREVAYNTLSKRDRKSRHLAAARYFESLGSDELAGALAAHYLAAYANAPTGPEADALAAQARVTLRGAAARAAALGSHDQAVAFLEQALQVTSDAVEEAALLELAGESASAAAHYERAEALLRRALGLRRELADRPAIARVTAAMGRSLLQATRIPAARQVLEPTVAELADLADDPGFVALVGQLARMYFLADDYHRAISVSDQVLETAEWHDLLPIVADTLVTRGSALASIGRRYEGIGAIEAGARLAEANALHPITLRARINRASFLSDDDPRAALEASRAVLELSRRLGQRDSIRIALDNLFGAALHTGDWDAAIAELEPALDEDLEPLERASLLSDTLAIRAGRGQPVAKERAEIDELLGGNDDAVAIVCREWCRYWEALCADRLAEAREACLEVIPVFAQVAIEAGRMAARAALWARDVDGTRADLAALDTLRGLGRATRTDRLSIRAGVAALEGRRGEALALYREALRTWRELGCAWDEALTAIDMVTVLDPAEPEVQAAAESAREVLVRLRARPFLERLEAAMARTVAREVPA